jgi:hypothetical protein
VHKDFLQPSGDLSALQQSEQQYQQAFLALEEVEKFEEQERQKPDGQKNRTAVAEKYDQLRAAYAQSPVAEIARRRLAALRQEPPVRTLLSSPGGASAPEPVPTMVDIVSAEGKVLATGRYLNRRWTHKLVHDKKILYYLKSDAINLNDFLQYRATVWGTVEKLPRSAIQLMTVTQVKPVVQR